MATTALSRYDILAKELVYRYKDKDASGQVTLKDPKWTPHNIKTLMICSEGALVEFYSNRSPEIIKFTGYSEDEKSKPVTAVIYDLNRVSAHLTNLRDLIVIAGGDMPLNRAIDTAKLQSLSSAFIGIYMLATETPNSTIEDLKNLQIQLSSNLGRVAQEISTKAQGYDFNMGLTDGGTWEVCSGTRKPNGQPYELSFKNGEITLNGNKKSFGTQLPRVLSYGLYLAGDLPQFKWIRFGRASFMSQAFHTNTVDYPADVGLSSYVSSQYLCMYEIVKTIQSRSKNEVAALSEEDKKLTEGCLALGNIMFRSKFAPHFFKGAMHYLKNSDLAEGTQEVFEANMSWLLSVICSGSGATVWCNRLGLPNAKESCTNERMKKFAAQCFARCMLATALCFEAKTLLGDKQVRMGVPDATFCSMRHALVFEGNSAPTSDSLTSIVARILHVVLAVDESVTSSLVSGMRGTLWRTESSTNITVDMVKKHFELVLKYISLG